MLQALGILGVVMLALAPIGGADGKPGPDDPAKWYPHVLKSNKQRAIIAEFFAGRRDGVFVDVGSAHYSDLSMTYFLEKKFGWSGIAVDALEHWGAGYAEHRPRTRFFTYIVTDHTGAKEPFYRLRGDIGSTALEDRAAELKGMGLPISEVLVPTVVLDDLLDRAGITKIDFLSMDIEGNEPAALAGFDIERFRPELVGIEAMPQNHEAIRAYFEQHGYRRIDAYLDRIESDWFFTCKEAETCARVPGERTKGGSLGALGKAEHSADGAER